MDRTLPAQLKSAARTALNLFLVIVAVLFLLYLLSGIYSVANNEVGVHQRFGKIINANVRPGMHYALPWPFDQVNKVPMPKVERITIQDFSPRFAFGENGPSFSTLAGFGTYAITGDNNLINVEFVLQYEVIDPVAYLFNLGEGIKNAERSTRRFLIEMACNNILHCIAKMGVDEALTNRERILPYVTRYLQEHMDAIECGLAITFVEITEITPPERVQEYFHDVNSATIDKERAINEAESYREVEILAAKGRSARLLAEGEAYRNEVIQSAQGEAERFLGLLSEYGKDKALTRYRLYMEAVQEVLASVEKSYIVDTSGDKPPATIKLLK